ncbi:site-specific integrase [Nocardia niwae]|uniref:site-specific integrase n=1 Tax=Nocardia niwae TaxID=626084 RepID=UPI003411EB8E
MTVSVDVDSEATTASSPAPFTDTVATAAAAETWPETQLASSAVAELAFELPVGRQELTHRRIRREGVSRLLAWLATFPGQTWQQRWEASAAETQGRHWRDAPVQYLMATYATGHASARGHVVAGISCLVCLRVLRPGYAWLAATHFNDTYRFVRQLTDPDFIAEVDQAAAALDIRERVRLDALNQLTRMVMHTGRGPRQLTPADVLECRATLVASGRIADALGLSWDMLRRSGVFPDDTPLFRVACQRGRLTVEQLVDRYDIACKPVRDVLVRYLRERSAGLDYISLTALAGWLCGGFWKDLEKHHPGLDTLNLPPEVAASWKQRADFQLKPGREGQPRLDRYKMLFAVRSFYLDIAQWALDDPSWANWAVRCPIRESDVRGSMKSQRQRRARMHQRTRTLAPLLPHLVDSVERHLQHMEKLLAAADAAQVGEQFTVDGTDFRRTRTTADTLDTKHRGAGHLRVEQARADQAINVTQAEEEAFWTWALVEILRHTGIRHEEMLELTHFSLTTHALADTGQVVPLLQIAPSKLDQERVLLIGPELAHVLARVVHRVRAGNPRIPLVSRYDDYEHVNGPPLPHLFQRRYGTEVRVMGMKATHRLLRLAIERAGLTGPDGQPLRYTPHDFRRIFATDAVASGLPVHIAAKLLGHNDLNTTQTYAAVYQDDVLRHHRDFIARRRALRPSSEYREPTPAEWADFEQHFTRRKVELGTCARPFGTPCRHEHACIRCPVLRPDPAQEPRLLAIVVNLNDRLREAHERGWLGEVDGLTSSIAAANQKLVQMRRIRSQSVSTELPLPTVHGPRR